MNSVIATWLGDFRRSEAHEALSLEARRALEGTSRVLERAFDRPWNVASPLLRSPTEMTGEDAVRLLTNELPHAVATLDPAAIVDGAVALLVWAAKHGRVARDVEYACLRVRREALERMADERAWPPGKSIVVAAMRDGVDPTDLDALRRHALDRGLAADFVDEFLPPGPTWSRRCFSAVGRALGAAAERFGVRIVQFSVQGNHMHLVVEAATNEALSQTMQGLAIRVAQGLNRVMHRKGRVFADRYHARALRTPTEVRRAIAYVRDNFAHHTGERVARDAYSSAAGEVSLPEPRTWLLRAGRRRAVLHKRE